MMFIILVLIAGIACQYEEFGSVPVDVKPSDICSDPSNKPKITVEPEPLYELNLGKPAKIICAATGMPMPYVYWVKGKKDMSGEEHRIRVTAVGEAILYFDKLQPGDVDMYTCVVEDCCRGTVQTFETEIRVRVNVQCTRKQQASYYWVVVWDYKTWEDAKVFCETKNMILATPHNDEENEQLHHEIQDSMGKDPNGKKFAHHNMIWMGISDGLVEGGFADVNTGEAMNYSNWLPKQPDNWKKYHVEGQDVVAMDRMSGEWDDSFGTWKRPFACWCPPKSMRQG